MVGTVAVREPTKPQSWPVLGRAGSRTWIIALPAQTSPQKQILPQAEWLQIHPVMDQPRLGHLHLETHRKENSPGLGARPPPHLGLLPVTGSLGEECGWQLSSPSFHPWLSGPRPPRPSRPRAPQWGLQPQGFLRDLQPNLSDIHWHLSKCFSAHIHSPRWT